MGTRGRVAIGGSVDDGGLSSLVVLIGYSTLALMDDNNNNFWCQHLIPGSIDYPPTPFQGIYPFAHLIHLTTWLMMTCLVHRLFLWIPIENRIGPHAPNILRFFSINGTVPTKG